MRSTRCAAAPETHDELYFTLGDHARAEALLADAMASPAGAGDAAEFAYAGAAIGLIWARSKEAGLPRTAADLQALGDRLAKTLGRDDLQYGIARTEAGRAYNELDDATHCEQALREALYAFNAALGPDHQYTKVTESNLAQQLVALGRDTEALRLLDEIVPWYATHAKSRHLELDESRVGALLGLGRAAEALAALDAIPAADLANAGDLGWKLDGLRGRALLGVGRRAEGLERLAAALEAGDKEVNDRARLDQYRRILLDAQRRKNCESVKHSDLSARAPPTTPLVVADACRIPGDACASRLDRRRLGHPLGAPESFTDSEHPPALARANLSGPYPLDQFA